MQLQITDIAAALGNIYNSIQNWISIFVIADALQNAYPAAISGIFKSNTELKYPRIPKINILLFVKITHINLGSIIKSEAFINSNYRILKTIFLKQLQLNYDNDF